MFMQDGDEWGVKTSEGKTGESYGRHGGRPSTGPGSSFGAGQGNDLLVEAEDLWITAVTVHTPDRGRACAIEW